jgi:Na+-transporting NADH:ubiquinone oxidoreductase subunit A
MSKAVKIRKGADIKLTGEPDKVFVNAPKADVVALKPSDFHGLTPKMVVKEGDQVKKGTTLFIDKYRNEIKFASPVSGSVKEIVRGDKRRILEVVVTADSSDQAEDFVAADPKSLSRDEIIQKMLAAGVWPFIGQRPFATIANPADMPKAVFITAMDTAPLAPDFDFVAQRKEDLLQTGLNAVSKLTEGDTHLNINGKAGHSNTFENLKGVKINRFTGPHPAGNVGVQIHHLAPLNKGEVVWTLNIAAVMTIGRLFESGKFDASTVVALTGSEVKAPKYYRTIIGSSIKSIVDGNINTNNTRIVSGNVLTGTTVAADSFVGFYDNQITVIPEGNERQFLLGEGWLGLGLKKFSFSRSYFSWLIPNRQYSLDTNLNGEHRPFVVTGQYEKVFPFSIYPVQLIKSIMVNDIEQMENLGIYEVAPEDFALCEYACTSKIDIQDIVRKGLDLVQAECA